ncbi:unnamed protein product, partial [Mesorhabditis belari]|uniref:GPI inositol-deacylase n=1 Tax=Mesorhabditis belari TaxID=2138241 RepID=A0AAF3FEM8_9BILA
MFFFQDVKWMLMTKYIAPTAAISAIYSAWYGWGKTENHVKIKSIDEAVEFLNHNKETPEALRYISNFDFDRQPRYLKKLSIRSLGILAGVGSEIVRQARVHQCKREDDDFLFQNALSKFDLGPSWKRGVDWLHRSPCLDEDLSCEDWQVWRPTQVERLQRLLQILFIETENQFSPDTVDIYVVDFLFNVFKLFDGDTPEIARLTLRILANVALNGQEYAERIFSTEWLQILGNLVTRGETLEERLIAHKICRNALHTLDSVPYKLPSDVYELHISQGEPVVDIVLIHGLCGSILYTWRQKDDRTKLISECWPKDWLPLDINDSMRILGVNYPSYLLHSSGAVDSLPQRAERFVKQLSSAGIGSRPVVFICHSMGGLLAKKMLLDSEELRKNTVGVLFIATPHRGSPIAEWGDYNFPFTPSEDVRFLHSKNQQNEKLNQDFGTISKEIPVIASMIETKESDLIATAKGIIVPTESAVFGSGVLYHIDEVHHNVCKPSERTSPTYGVVLNFVRDSIAAAKKRNPSKEIKKAEPQKFNESTVQNDSEEIEPIDH